MTIQGASNLTNTLQSNFALYVYVSGATGWLDANAAYAGVITPVNNGDAALDYSNSTPTFKRATFGTTVRTGNVFVRVGVKSGTNVSFTNIILS